MTKAELYQKAEKEYILWKTKYLKKEIFFPQIAFCTKKSFSFSKIIFTVLAYSIRPTFALFILKNKKKFQKNFLKKASDAPFFSQGNNPLFRILNK